MRLVRQEHAGDWTDIFRRISATIAGDA